MGMGEIMGDIGGDFMQMLAALGILLAFVAGFWLWSTGGTWILVVVLVLAALGFLLYKAYGAGYRINL